MIMGKELSQQTEQYLASMVAGGMFPSKEAALEAAVAALREKTEAVPFVPDEHMARVEQAIESADAGLTNPMTSEYWEGLRQNVRDIAAGKSPSS
jgi:hypothetical protein